jgi:hypothetical protein
MTKQLEAEDAKVKKMQYGEIRAAERQKKTLEDHQITREECRSQVSPEAKKQDDEEDKKLDDRETKMARFLILTIVDKKS